MEIKKHVLAKNIIKAIERTLNVNLLTRKAIINKLDVFCNVDSEEPNQINIEYEVY